MRALRSRPTPGPRRWTLTIGSAAQAPGRHLAGLRVSAVLSSRTQAQMAPCLWKVPPAARARLPGSVTAGTTLGQRCHDGPHFEEQALGAHRCRPWPQLGVTQLRAGRAQMAQRQLRQGLGAPAWGVGGPSPSPKAPHLSSGTSALAAPGRPQHTQTGPGQSRQSADMPARLHSAGLRQRPHPPSVLLTAHSFLSGLLTNPPPAPSAGPAHTQEPGGTGRCGRNRRSSRGATFRAPARPSSALHRAPSRERDESPLTGLPGNATGSK